MLLKHIEQFYDKHHGRRCFIVCPGFTLNTADFSGLKNDDILIGVNSAYLACKPLGFHLDYLVTTEQKHIDETLNTGLFTVFFTEGAAVHCQNHIQRGTNPYFIMPDRKPLSTDSEADQHFSKDLTKGSFIIISVVFQAIQLAFYMGFKDVYIVGMDMQCIDGHYYFDDDIYLRGKHKGQDAYHEAFPQLNHELPMHPGWMNYYMKIYRGVFEKAGRRLVNCSPDSQIIALEKQGLEEVL